MNLLHSDYSQDIPSYEVYEYSIVKLVDILAQKANTSIQKIEEKNHRSYFEDYFSSKSIDAKTIIVENGYVDKDYLLDFSYYYLTCFKHYKKTCTRVHFFNRAISKEFFERALQGEISDAQSELQACYLGFMVIKPLPETVIGRTCLKAYDSDSGRRRYLCNTKVPVNLFGFNLYINSLPFQEQDRVVAACATSALWSTFHATGELFHHSILSPSAITQAASQFMPLESRYFPNEGLELEQMASAVRRVGLEPYTVSAMSEIVFKTTLFAYLNAGIPVIFGFDLIDDDNISLGRHAVVVTGYSIPKDAHSKSFEKTPLTALNIDEIYVHDDQIGPYARMSIATEPQFRLFTLWADLKCPTKCFIAKPCNLLVPLYYKIRIPYIKILTSTLSVINVLKSIPKSFFDTTDFSWDIFLTTNSQFKNEIINEKLLKGNELKSILTKNMPRYIWRALARKGDKKIVEFIFDATDIEQGDFLHNCIHYDPNIKNILHDVSKNKDLLESCFIILSHYS